MTPLLQKAALAHWFRQHRAGVFLTLLVAMAAQFLADHYGAPVMLMAILLGIPFNFLADDPRFAAGIGFAAKGVLRLGVALLGLRISGDLLAGIGLWDGVLVAVAVGLTIGLGLLAAPLFGRNRYFGFLAGGAVGICGASAALAIAALLPKRHIRDEDVTFTVVGVTLLSSVAMIAYPILVVAWGFDTHDAGLFLGGTIHDVAQVVGAGYSVSQEAGDLSTFVKLFRVLMLAPVVVLGAMILRQIGDAAGDARPPILPAFVAGFLGLAALGLWGGVPQAVLGVADTISRGALVVAVAAVGMKTSIAALAEMGRAAMAFLGVLTGFIACVIGIGLWV